MDLSKLTWTCHICGQERPDAQISVHTRVHPIEGCGGTTMRENIRYCNDNADCFLRAQTFTFLKETDERTE